MSDEAQRRLERRVSEDPELIERLKKAWARTLVWTVCEKCRQEIAGPLIAGPFYEEHAAECLKEREAVIVPPGASRRGTRMSVVRYPSAGSVTGRAVKDPYWWRSTIKAGEDRVLFFDATRPSFFDTNWHYGAQLPPGFAFYLYGVSLIPDATAPVEEVARVHDHGVLRMRSTNLDMTVQAGRVVMDDQPRVAGQAAEDDEILSIKGDEVIGSMKRMVNMRHRGPVRDLTVSNRPIEILSDFAFQWELLLRQPVQRDTALMLVMFGVAVKGLVPSGGGIVEAIDDGT